MSSLFSALCEARDWGWNLSTVLVKAYLEECGSQPVGVVAEACSLSVRTVERALVVIKRSAVSKKMVSTTLTHEHVKQNKTNKSTASDVTVTSGGDAAGLSAQWVNDPLAQRLLACEVLPWCVEIVMTRVKPEVIARQLVAHEWRLKSGYPFKSHPARFLFRACLNDYAVPEQPVEAQAMPRRVQTVQAVPADLPVVTVPRPTAMTREGALHVIRMGLRSRLAVMRDEALRLAREWDIDVTALLPGNGVVAMA